MSNITQVVNVDKNMKTLKKTIHASDVDQLLSSTGPYTLIAPDDQAFEKLEKGMIDTLLEPQNRSKLASLVNNHVIKGKISISELKNGEVLTSLSGHEWKVDVNNGLVKIGDAQLAQRESKVSNGMIIHSDTVIQAQG
jgi:uncharacterized surface protein with fasciclin (FAS1) repeats